MKITIKNTLTIADKSIMQKAKLSVNCIYRNMQIILLSKASQQAQSTHILHLFVFITE